MPNKRTTSSDLDDQLRWKREMEISRELAYQRSPGGFFPGPGAEAGGKGGGASGAAANLGGEAQAAAAAADILSGKVSGTEAAKAAAGQALKQTKDKVIWPIVTDQFDGSGLVAIILLQLWWVLSKLKVTGFLKMELWEELFLGLATMLEAFLIIFLLTLISLLVCALDTSCGTDMATQIGLDLVTPILGLLNI